MVANLWVPGGPDKAVGLLQSRISIKPLEFSACITSLPVAFPRRHTLAKHAKHNISSNSEVQNSADHVIDHTT